MDDGGHPHRQQDISKKVQDAGTAKSHVVYINWDGFAWYYYELANRERRTKTPVLNGLLEEGVLFTRSYTGIPSITNPMQTAVVTGAWPAVTGNCYRCFDKEKNMVVRFRRENRAETIAEAAVRQGLRAASVHQFILQGRGTSEGDRDKPYIQVGKHADCRARFDAAVKLIKGRPVGKWTRKITVDRLPEFIAIYMDDLDGIGHNDSMAYGVLRARTEAGRLEKVLQRLNLMDRKLGEFIHACKEKGIYESMSFLLTSDHGMAPYGQQGKNPDEYGYSKLPDLINTLKDLGYSVEALGEGEKPKPSTDIVIITAGLEVQLTFTGNYSDEDIRRIINAVKVKKYVGRIMEKPELLERGAMPGFADIVISPSVPYCFHTGQGLYRARGQHDSLDESAQHVFSLMWGKGIKKGLVYDKTIYAIDFAKTMAALLHIDSPRDATGRMLNEILSDNLK